jgi:hypothetical protein
MENNTKVKDLPEVQPDGWYAFPDTPTDTDDTFDNLLSFYYVDGYLFGPARLNNLTKMEIVKFQGIAHYMVDNMPDDLTKINIKKDKENLESFDIIMYLQDQNIRLADVQYNHVRKT